MNVYNLSRNWFNFCFENPEIIKPNHTALYFFSIEHCNRMGWKEKFGFPTQMAMEAIGIKSYNTYIKTFNEIESFGFIKVVERSKNQYSANIIALSKFNKALDKALDKALIKHGTKHCRSTEQSNCSIDIQVYKDTNEQENNIIDPSKTTKPKAGKILEFYETYSKIKPFDFRDAKFKNAYFEACDIADGADIVNVSASLYVEYCQKSGMEIKFIPKSINWLKDQMFKMDWMEELKKSNGDFKKDPMEGYTP